MVLPPNNICSSGQVRRRALDLNVGRVLNRAPDNGLGLFPLTMDTLGGKSILGSLKNS